MPIYEYRCDDCGTKFEKLVRRASDSAGLACPSCGKDHLTLQLSVFSPQSGTSGKRGEAMCPSGGPCPTPGLCGLN